MDTYPWAASPQQHEWPPLLQLRPEDVGFDGYSMPREGSTSKQMPPSDAEGDPLVSSQLPEQPGIHYTLPGIGRNAGHTGNLEVAEPPALLWKTRPSPRFRPMFSSFSFSLMSLTLLKIFSG